MRLARLLLPLLIILAAGGVGYVYSARKAAQQREAPPPPKELPAGVASQTNEFTWSQTVEGRLTVEVRAANTQQIGDRTELQDVELKLHHKDGKAYDRVRSKSAELLVNEGLLKSEGDVEITIGVPAGHDESKSTGRLLNIRSSGVTFEARTGKARTDRDASFTFDRGDGKSKGAEYDPSTRELRLYSNVELKWNASKPGEKTMVVSAGNLLYREAESKVYLAPWSKLQRDTLSVNAADSVVTLKEGAIELVEAKKASGTDKYPARSIEFSADHLRMSFHPNGEIQQVAGETNARLVSTSAAARTTVTTNRIDLDLEPLEQGSQLRKARANGNSVVETDPLAAAADIKILRSDSLTLDMRDGGEEIRQVETHSPGSLEFVPKSPGRRRRWMDGERMWITYGAANQIESFRAVTVKTRSQAEAQKGKPTPPPVITSSRDMTAAFDASGQMTRLEQWNDFRYEEGERRGRAEKATLESASERITLDGAARVWDPSGSTAGRKIVLNQRSGEFEAEGEVTSTRNPEKKTQPNGMLAADEPVHAKADRMLTKNDNRLIRYEGNALLWQGSNRLQAEIIEIDRIKGQLTADRKVTSQFADRSVKKQAAQFTTVTAARLVYQDRDRIAHYSGGAVMKRPDMQVTAREIRAHLKQQSENGNSLEKAFADGAVQIVQTGGGRDRTGTAEHAQYYTADERVVLNGGKPMFVDSIKGSTSGRELTYYANNDRLLVDGAEKDPAVSRIRRN